MGESFGEYRGELWGVVGESFGGSNGEFGASTEELSRGAMKSSGESFRGSKGVVKTTGESFRGGQ